MLQLLNVPELFVLGNLDFFFECGRSVHSRCIQKTNCALQLMMSAHEELPEEFTFEP